jgi:excisionase family DNA binding protein
MQQRIAYSVDEAAQRVGIGPTKLREEIREGRLVARKVGKRTLITASDLAAWAHRLPKRSTDDSWRSLGDAATKVVGKLGNRD